jgi:multisubunit Na+/H+ antiporter MnhB subunit
MRIAAFIAFLVVAAFLLVVPASLRPFGEPQMWEMDRYFLEHAQEELAANNVCTAIVFDYRGYDTLGEATVLFTAVVGVAAILRRLKEKERSEAPYV